MPKMFQIGAHFPKQKCENDSGKEGEVRSSCWKRAPGEASCLPAALGEF
uniref:Uncharacterized protein n=1 Tax=Anguilla anguilla TaxID=7936 RepID=A0A0E9S0Q6_ANGAN